MNGRQLSKISQRSPCSDLRTLCSTSVSGTFERKRSWAGPNVFGDSRETFPVPSLRQYHSLREPDVRAVQPSARLHSGARDHDRAEAGGRWKLGACGRRRPAPLLRQRGPRRLQLADPGGRARPSLPRLPAQRHHPGHLESGESRPLARTRIRQASLVLQPASLEAAARRRAPKIQATVWRSNSWPIRPRLQARRS